MVQFSPKMLRNIISELQNSLIVVTVVGVGVGGDGLDSAGGYKR